MNNGTPRLQKKNTPQRLAAMGRMSERLLAEAKDGDFDIAIIYVKRNEPKTFQSHAELTLFGAAMIVLDMFNRMGASPEMNKRVRDMMEDAFKENAGRISNNHGKVTQGAEEAPPAP